MLASCSPESSVVIDKTANLDDVTFSQGNQVVLNSDSGVVTVETLVPDGVVGQIQVEIGDSFETNEAVQELDLDGFDNAGESITFGSDSDMDQTSIGQIQVSIPLTQTSLWLQGERSLVILYHIETIDGNKVGFITSRNYSRTSGKLKFYLRGFGQYQPVWLNQTYTEEKEVITAAPVRLPKRSEETAQTTKDPGDITAPGLPLVASYTKLYSSSPSQTVSWQAPGDKDVVKYHVKVCTDTSCSSNCSVSTMTTDTSITVNNLSAGSSYYTCVAAEDSSGNLSPFSRPQNPVTIAEPGSLDLDFNSSGLVTQNGAASGFDSIYDLVGLPDGSSIAVGAIFNGNDNDVSIWKFKPNGSLDSNFASSGVLIVDDITGNGPDQEIAHAVALDPSGKILIAGYGSNGSDDDGFILRIDGNGNFDTTFNSTGVALLDNIITTSQSERIQDIAIDADGNILVTGYAGNGIDNDLFLGKVDSTGAIDTSFGSLGYSSKDGGAADRANGIAIDGNGQILVGGFFTGTDRKAAVCRYNTDGSLDTGFAVSGCLELDDTAGGPGDDEILDIRIDSQNNTIATGFSSNGSNKDMAIWKIDTGGNLDTSFNGTGYVIHDSAAGGADDDLGGSIALSPGRIYISGSSQDGQMNHVLWCYKADGSICSNFSDSGYMLYELSGQGSASEAVITTPSGSLLSAGRLFDPAEQYNAALWMILP
ncbi:fibronectin type III domain-containing protein [Pseudobacteriovorax antillogorgiicola]|nr:fibronectin type III domain-containing protein [Pseudobacteriovorax antillogorgiicola]